MAFAVTYAAAVLLITFFVPNIFGDGNDKDADS